MLALTFSCCSLSSNSLGHRYSPAKWNTELVLFNWMHGSEESNIIIIIMTQSITLEDDGNTEGANVRQVLCPPLSSVFFLCHSIFEMLSTHVQVLAKSFICVLVLHCIECCVYLLYPLSFSVMFGTHIIEVLARSFTCDAFSLACIHVLFL